MSASPANGEVRIWKMFLSQYYGEYIETIYFNNISLVWLESLLAFTFWLRNNLCVDLTKVTSASRVSQKTQIRERHDIRVRGKNIMSRWETGQLWAAGRKKLFGFTSQRDTGWRLTVTLLVSSWSCFFETSTEPILRVKLTLKNVDE